MFEWVDGVPKEIPDQINFVVRLHHETEAGAKKGCQALIKALASKGCPGPGFVTLMSQSDVFQKKLSLMATREELREEWWPSLPAMVRGNVGGSTHCVGLYIREFDFGSWMHAVSNVVSEVCPLDEKSEWTLKEWNSYGFNEIYKIKGYAEVQKLETSYMWGRTSEEALVKVKEQHEKNLISTEVMLEGGTGIVEKTGSTLVEARERALQVIPEYAEDVSEPEITGGEIRQAECQAMSEDEVLEKWQADCDAPKETTLERLEMTIKPQKGFLGLGKQNGVWTVHYREPFIAKVSYWQLAKISYLLRTK